MARYFIMNEILREQQGKSEIVTPKQNRKKTTKCNTLSEEEIEYDKQVIDKFKRVCRLCADDNANIAIFKNAERPALEEDIKIYIAVELSEDDGLPNRICEQCNNQIENIKNFKSMALESDSRFRFLKIRHEAKIEKTKGCDAVKSLPSYKPFVSCLKCGKQFSSRVTCKRHILYCVKPAEPSSSHVCETCGKEFKKKVFYKRHLRTHSDILPFKCSLCPHKCRASDSLRIHMRTHTGERPFHCEQCPKAFTTKSNLNKHLRSHKTDHAFECNECQRGFHSAAEMQRHQRAVHMGIKDFPCNVCGKEFAWKKEMRKHQIRVHNMAKANRCGREPDYIKMQRKMMLGDHQHQEAQHHPVHHQMHLQDSIGTQQLQIGAPLIHHELIVPYSSTHM